MSEVNSYGEDQDLLVCVIVAHGGEDNSIGTKQDFIFIEDVCKFFDAFNCPALAGKPKIVLRFVG